MSEQAVSATEMREKFADFLEGLNRGRGRVLVTKHGEERAYLISVRELRALEETLAVLENEPLMRSLKRGMDDATHGRLRDARDVFAELDAELTDEE